MGEGPKRNGAGAFFRDEEGRILLVKPTYKEGWLLPGGKIELGETPSSACSREVKEELGIEREFDRVLCIDYESAGTGKTTYIFDGGVLSERDIASIALPPDELSEFRLVTTDEASRLLRPKGERRLPFVLEALRERRIVAIEDGAPLDPVERVAT